MSVYFVLKLIIFVMMGSTNDVCYFIFKKICNDGKYYRCLIFMFDIVYVIIFYY